ncbi:allantoinase PuuE [Rhodophyticola sp. CCM32]|uniref:allantoinase PuuE n=1 Tax=Rhodophyticola sp. CCM32 TaxID=2916397 RepID=UPI00107F0BA4|nr:allantoinase PuuE [Rhodophyticola sp. CCM32]QBY00328.1 allantoinase PuuE [Rhodophyticola sp. CCM32]
MPSDPPRYPRDMHGYGADTPDPHWPGGAKLAIQIVLNYEEGGENNVLHGDPASEAFLSEIVGAAAWPGQRHWNMDSIYEYGARAGFWRLHRLFTGLDIPLTVYGVATALARSPAQVSAMQEAGWEIASHGLKWIEYKDVSPKDEAAHMAEAIRLHREVTGERPRGWYTGRCSEHTLRLATEEGGFAYVADSYADDLPYWQQFGDRSQLVVPYTLDANDMRFATPQGFNAGDQFEAYLRDTFDALYAEGQAGAPKMMSVGLHCRLVGRPGRIMALKRFLEYAKAHSDVWFARRIDIAEHWQKTHPDPRQKTLPSGMDKDAFTKFYGAIFEYSPWVAEQAHALELGLAHDTATGLANAMARAFRGGSDAARLAVLKAHPDLAGKLAAAKRLTEDSSAEQASAGLDALSDQEHAQFTRLNTAYMEKHGFPFIIAVRDHDKSGILAAFEQRLHQDSETEFAEACRQVERIALHRLRSILP